MLLYYGKIINIALYYFSLMASFPQIPKEILMKAKRGDIAAFETILFAYEKPIFNYIRRVVGGAPDAEDITQETFIKFYTHIGSLDPEKNIKSFLFTIATRTAYDWLRKKQKQPKIFSFDDTEFPVETIGDDSTYYNVERLTGLEEALEKIKPQQKSILMLFYREGFSYQEIADIFNLPINTVKTHLRRAKQSLREELSSQI